MGGTWIQAQDGSVLLITGITHPIEESEHSWVMRVCRTDNEWEIAAQYDTEEAAESALAAFLAHVERCLRSGPTSVFVFPSR